MEQEIHDAEWYRKNVKTMSSGQSRMTAEEYRNFLSPGKMHKYNAKKVVTPEHTFDSQREFDFKQLLDFHKITYSIQNRYVLQEGFHYMGSKIREIAIIPDFNIFKDHKLVAIVDVKGMVLPNFKLKIKMLKHGLSQMGSEIPIFIPSSKKEMQETIQALKKLITRNNNYH